jgi:hypothetical protein
MPTTELKDVIPILDVRDVEAALQFYAGDFAKPFIGG